MNLWPTFGPILPLNRPGGAFFFLNASVQSNIILHFLVVSSCSFHLISEAIHWKLKQSLAITLEGSYSGGEQLPQISGS